jgi:hypothetical protein
MKLWFDDVKLRPFPTNEVPFSDESEKLGRQIVEYSDIF